jgi:O-acetyl-ADP-ribose deacetylase (regulator of RNase III)
LRTAREFSSGRLRIVIAQRDITHMAVHAIVNAANERMLGGSGVDGAIHRAAGPELLEACRRVPEIKPGVRCPTGQARITPGFKLPARHLIHTVGPVYDNDAQSAPFLASAYRSCLLLADEHLLSSIAFPAISCGVFGYPLDKAAGVALTTCSEHRAQHPEGTVSDVHFALFGNEPYDVWVATAESLFGTQP